jgi:diguanylate cyclase (GGDEF)-like protein
LGREPVSGLLNRQGLDAGMRRITATDLVQPEARAFGVIILAAESLRSIMRTLGPDMYEEVIARTSRRLIDAYGGDFVARLSGEDTAILIPDMTDADADRHAAVAVALLADPVEVDEVPVRLDPVAGVALSPQHGRELGTLLTKAQQAAGEAQRQGRRSMVYVRQAADVIERRIAMLRELRSALREPARHAEIAVLYQPQVDLASGALSGVEALLRWTHPRWGPVPTDELIEVVEPTEVMQVLTRHMLDTVATQLQLWNRLGRSLRAAVNVSERDLHEPGFVDALEGTLRAHDINPWQLTIEITERMLISDSVRVSQVAARLARLGVGLSLDDFGTGYASMQQLRLLPLSEVKIDRSYVNGIVDNPADLAIVRSVHQLASALHVSVVAEGVEDQRTALALTRLTGVVGQGYFFGHPMTAEALRYWRYDRAPRSRPGLLRRRLGLRRPSRRLRSR